MGVNEIKNGDGEVESVSGSSLFQLPSLETQETWYPTLRKTVWVLSQLRDFVKVCISFLSFSCCYERELSFSS